MLKIPVVATVSVALLSLAGCSSSPKVDINAGWDWELNSSVAYNLGADFDYFTGEFSYAGEDSGTGLSLPSTAEPEPSEFQQALTDSQASMCERYVDPYDFGDDPLVWQGYEVKSVMGSTVDAAIAPLYSDEYLRAYAEVNDYVDANARSLDSVEVLSDKWDEIVAERDQMRSERWSAEYPQLADEIDRLSELRSETSREVYTSSTVRKIQDLYIDRCDLQVADDYQYPTPEQLEIVVDEANTEQLESSQSDS